MNRSSGNRQDTRKETPMSTTLHHSAIVCASLLAVACASSEQATSTTQESAPQDRPYRSDGTPQIETEQEAKEVAVWSLQGRGYLSEEVIVETKAFERDGSWFVGVQEPGDVHPVGSGHFLEINRSGSIIRMLPSL